MYGEDCDFFKLKGVVCALLSALHAEAEFSRSALPFLHPGRGADITVSGKKIGWLGEIHPLVAAKYDAEERLLAAEIDLVALFETERGGYSFRPFSKYPSAERDLAVVVDASVPAGDMLDAVRRAKINDLTSADIFDVYRGAQVGEGKKSVALTFGFASPERTLTDDEIAAAMKKILSLLRREFGAKIRQ